MDFERDDAKSEANERKHGVSFAEAMTVLADPLSLTGFDPGHSDDEDRYITMGMSVSGRLQWRREWSAALSPPFCAVEHNYARRLHRNHDHRLSDSAIQRRGHFLGAPTAHSAVVE